MRALAFVLLGLILSLAAAQAQTSQCLFSGGPNITTLTASATGTTGAVGATLPAAVSKFTYLCGFTVTSVGATAGTTGLVTVTGLVGGTMSFAYIDPSTGQGFIGANFAPFCLPSLAANTAIVVTAPGGGTGTIQKATNAWGCNQ